CPRASPASRPRSGRSTPTFPRSSPARSPPPRTRASTRRPTPRAAGPTSCSRASTRSWGWWPRVPEGARPCRTDGRRRAEGHEETRGPAGPTYHGHTPPRRRFRVPDVAPHHVRSPLGKSLTLSLIAVLVACAALPTRAETSLTVPPGLARSETGELQATAAPLEATYYVAPDGDDRNDGRTVETPFATIAKAAAVVRPGDVVMLRGGVYHEYNVRDSWVTSGEPGRPITFMSYPGERAIIDGSHVPRDPESTNPSAPELIKLVGLDWYVFDGLELRNGAGRGLALEGDHHVVRNVVSHSNHGDGVFVRGSYNLIEDTVSYDNYSRSNGGDSADGIKIDSGKGNVIRRFLAFENSDDGI